MGFIDRVEVQAAKIITKPKSFKLTPLKKLRSKKLVPLPKKRGILKAGPASGSTGEQVGFSQLTETRKLTPMLRKELDSTDPFNFQNETWARFTKNVAPKLLVALMLDMNIVPKNRKAEFSRYLERRLRSLTK